jgi:serine/threonine protein kinase/tetratricopeptide (TPR) repeat protein
MGVVYAAVDDRLDRAVAVKTIRKSTAGQHSRERLWREARSAASVNHPNICHVYEIGEAAGELFIAMELLEGESLATRLEGGPLVLPEVTETALSILAALGALHLRGLVHRDLKPSNVFLTPVGVKLLDFGLARPIEKAAGSAETDLTLPGSVVGTPSYVAPEQLRGETLDARSDLFAMGVMLFQMLTGKPPFAGPSVVDVLHAILHEQPPVLSGSAAIAAVDRIIHRALAKSPAERYQTAQVMADDLRAAMRLVDSSETTRPVTMTRLMVLPLRILRPDPETDFLAFSLSDAVTSSLSGFESLIVRSSVTASGFAGPAPDLAAIASAADVDVVLTGTLLRAGEQLRINMQAVEAPGGTVLWSHTAQVPLGDIFQLQDELARRIVDSLALPLTARDRRALKHDVPASAKAYEFYLRANQLSYQPKDYEVARDLYLQCLEEDPNFAPAWARLGRIYRVLGFRGGQQAEAYTVKTEEAFQRALAINPDLSIAHNLYTNFEVEMGRARDAMLRLLTRARGRPGDPELFAGLVQACRYCGLLSAAVGAYKQARRLEPGIRTSVAHAYLMLGDYQQAIETNVENPPTLNAIALELMGREAEAIQLLKSLERPHHTASVDLWGSATLALLEGDRATSLKWTEQLTQTWTLRDPCARYYLARHLARLGEHQAALAGLRGVVEGGFFCASFLMRDPWLDPLRSGAEFRDILQLADARQRDAAAAFLSAEGDRILGVASPGVA